MSSEGHPPEPLPEDLDATPETAQRRQIRPFRLLAGALAIGAIGVGVKNYIDYIITAHDRATSAVDTLAQLEGVRPSTVLGEGLHDSDTLPGRNLIVTTSQRQVLENSTVSLLSRKHGTNDGFTELCTGVKVSVGGQDYIQTAAHCGSFSYSLKPGHIAYNSLPVDADDYGIIQANKITRVPRTITETYFEQPIAVVTADSSIADGVDMSLLKVVPYRGDTSAYTSIPAIPIEQTLSKHPMVGEQVGLYSVPGSVNNTAVKGLGTYLGRVRDPSLKSNQLLDVVGLQVADASQDPCEHGASGSSFIAADGYVSGPAHHRGATMTEKGKPFVNYDDPGLSLQERLQDEQATGIDLSKFDVVCTFSVPNTQDYSTTISGFAVPATN